MSMYQLLSHGKSKELMPMSVPSGSIIPAFVALRPKPFQILGTVLTFQDATIKLLADFSRVILKALALICGISPASAKMVRKYG